MAIRQYVGARYVPRFTGLYDATQVYDALDVVDNGLGTSYIAKKTVPAGTPLTDTDFWFIYGASSGAIINLQNQIGDISSLETLDKDNLVDAINSVHDHRYIFIGDSYMHASGSNNGWLDRLAPILGITSADYFDNSVGGAGFAVPEPERRFLRLLQDIESSITEPDLITDIVVLGGANDFLQTEADIVTAIAAFMSYAKSQYPKAKIKVGMIAGTGATNSVGYRYARIARAYANCSPAEYLNNLEYVFHNYSLISNDGIHPTNEGYEILTQKIASALNGGCAVKYYDTGVITPDVGWVSSSAAYNKYTVDIDNNVETIQFYSRIGITTTDPTKYKSVTYNNRVLIGTLDSDLVRGVLSDTYEEWNFNKIPCYAIVRCTSDNSQTMIFAELQIYNNGVYLLSNDIVLNSSSKYQSVDNIAIFAAKFVGDTMYF